MTSSKNIQGKSLLNGNPLPLGKKAVSCYHANIGACNGCDLEVLNLVSGSLLKKFPFEVYLVRTLKNAEVVLFTGSLSRPMVRKIKEIKESLSASKIILAVGACAIDGGPWRKSYSIVGGIDKILPTNYFVPGCPPPPESILYSIESALFAKKKKFSPLLYKEK